jgi:hypothetical protein
MVCGRVSLFTNITPLNRRMRTSFGVTPEGPMVIVAWFPDGEEGVPPQAEIDTQVRSANHPRHRRGSVIAAVYTRTSDVFTGI